ncbi:MAG TPA: hypothetical protein PJ990_16090, partial [Saprospiraceae bacterium]|nr:hypothetical protein [Saprospiraceae bacterium]
AFTSSVAANVDLDDNLELVAGFSVYKVIINNLNGMSGNSMNPINIAVDGRYRDGFTSVADINLDGKLDIIIIAESDKTNVGVYCYTIENNQAILLAKIGQYKPNTGWQTSGPVSVAYNKSKNRMDLFCSVYGNNLNEIVCFSYNGSQLLEKVWSYPINDVVTLSGITLFDINNDGNLEVLYKDNDSFQIINYENDTPNLVYSYPCGFISYSNYPVIANIDCTDQAKICVICDSNHLNGVLDTFDPLYEAVGFLPSFCTPKPTYNCDISYSKVPTDVISFTLPVDGSGNYKFIFNSNKPPTLTSFLNQFSFGLYSEQPNEDDSCLNLIIADGQNVVETVNGGSINGCFNSVQLTPGKKYWLTFQMVRTTLPGIYPNKWNVEIVDLGNGNILKNNSGVLTVFGAPEGSRLAPARKIWNQYAYNPLFINDDGSIPQYQKNHATYKDGKYNNFMVQESLIDENSFYPVPAA